MFKPKGRNFCKGLGSSSYGKRMNCNLQPNPNGLGLGLLNMREKRI